LIQIASEFGPPSAPRSFITPLFQRNGAIVGRPVEAFATLFVMEDPTTVFLGLTAAACSRNCLGAAKCAGDMFANDRAPKFRYLEKPTPIVTPKFCIST